MTPPPARLPPISLPPRLLQLRCRRFLALPKTSLYWMSPRWGATAEQVPVRCQGWHGGVPAWATWAGS